ncbi:chromosome partitioning protein [Pseudonocardia sichuanensis]|uniref:MinD-like ATPase involved in chromosome partitioning or flagellar assembly n=1 Tax=Pseudonocardia kunmingensis TaxID=630975 RepID=A0A543D9J7_9PSEU|nr:CpsD/CapB family tyrosine-protein kinase [Pseudonocardia kunmingensis]TQM06013.1 MinD-like ATPase involved in chromosome partitioning or flagellar assembly [Pseudonocardia kunmingensis]
MMVAVLSLKGSPGVTTFCVALAARWPGTARRVLLEADPAGGDLAVRFSLDASPGLLSLAADARGAGPEVIGRHVQLLPGGIPVVAAPPDAELARGALAALVASTDPDADRRQGGGAGGVVRGVADLPDTVVIVDCGRVDPGSPAMPLVRAADVMLVLTRAGAGDLAHLVRRLEQIGHWSPHPVLLLVGKGHSGAAVTRELGVTPLGRVPEDVRGAAVLSGQRAVVRWVRAGPSRSLLGQFAQEIAARLADPHPQPPPAAQGRLRRAWRRAGPSPTGPADGRPEPGTDCHVPDPRNPRSRIPDVAAAVLPLRGRQGRAS